MLKNFKNQRLSRIICSILIFITVVIVNNKSFCEVFSNTNQESGDNLSFRLTDIVCSYVERLYVYPDRIKPDKMLVKGLLRLERTIPELLVDFNDDSGDITIRVDDKTLEISTKNLKTLNDTCNQLKNAFNFINKYKQSEKISSDDIMYEGLNGMLSEQLDPHTMVLPPKDFNEFKIGTSGQFGGLGMVVGIRDGVLSVISPIEGTPADKAGLKAGDQIIEIDGDSTINMTLQEAVNKLRGKPNTFVKISVLKYKSAVNQILSIERKIIKIPTVDDKVMEDGIGYIKIRNFQNDTAEALKEHIYNLKETSGKIRGIIIDLRNNSGGLLDQAILATDQFIDSGNIVITVGPGGKSKDIQTAKKSKSDELDFPIVVLINSGSASGAEIMVGALKENNRVVVIGNRSFGKGSVQQLIDLIDGAAIKLTMAKYLTPYFNEVQSKGIIPDIYFTPVIITEDEIDLFREHSYLREEDLLEEGNNKHKPKSEIEKSVREIKYLKEIAEKSEDSIENGDDEPTFVDDEDPYKVGDLTKDNLVQFAKQIIKNTKKSERKAILEDISPLLNEIEDKEEKKMFFALKEIGIDWSDGKLKKATPAPVADLLFENKTDEGSTPINGQIKSVKAGDKLQLIAKVSNKGNGTMYRVRGITESENLFLEKLEFIFGKIKSGETKSYTKTVEIPENIVDREDKITLKFTENNGYAPNDIINSVRVNSLNKPQFAYSFQISDRGDDNTNGNNDGLIQKGEDICLTLFVKNIGKGSSGKTSISIKNVSEDEIFVKKGRDEFKDLLPGETRSVDMQFGVKENVSFNKFSMDVLIGESTFGTYLIDTIDLNVEDEGSPDLLSRIPAKLKVIKDNTPVFGIRGKEESQIAYLNRNTILNSDGRIRDLFRVDLPSNKYGWIPANNVENEEMKQKSNIENIELLMQHIPPSIKINTQNLELLSNLERITLSGIVEDDKEVKSVYAYVNNDKVYFKSRNSEPQSKDSDNKQEESKVLINKLDFLTEIPLKDGPNAVTIVARDNEDLITSESLVITKINSSILGSK